MTSESRLPEDDPDNPLFADIVRVARKIGGVPTATDYNEHGNHSRHRILREADHNRWYEILQRLGFEVETVQGCPECGRAPVTPQSSTNNANYRCKDSSCGATFDEPDERPVKRHREWPPQNLGVDLDEVEI